MNDYVTRMEFIKLISSECQEFGGDFPHSDSELLERGIETGWILSEDRLFKDSVIERRNCARIIHEYMRRVLNIPDIEDISPAYSIKDIFDCHVCTNHIAQVVLRNIIQCNCANMFGLSDAVTHKDAVKMAEAVESLRKILAK